MIRRIKLLSSLGSEVRNEILDGIQNGFLKPLKILYQKQQRDALIMPVENDEFLVVLDKGRGGFEATSDADEPIDDPEFDQL